MHPSRFIKTVEVTVQPIKWLWLSLAASLWLAAGAFAAEPAQPRYNTVEFQVDVQREVQNDLLNAILYVELNDGSAAALANAINKSVNDALRVAKDYKGVRVRSGNNQTYPVYSKGNQLQRLKVTSGHNLPQPRFAMARAATSSAQEVTAPSLEAGVSQLTVTANGAIEVVEK